MISINEKIIQALEEQNIGVNTGVLCLLGMYYEIDFEPLYDSCNLVEITVKQLNASGIYEYDIKSNTIEWNIPLFDGQVANDGWEWIHDYQNLFRSVRKDAAGTFDNVKKKMIKFFQENPTVRADDIINAAKAYIDSVNDPKYLQRADYFIKKHGVDTQSRLKEFLEMKKYEPTRNSYDLM